MPYPCVLVIIRDYIGTAMKINTGYPTVYLKILVVIRQKRYGKWQMIDNHIQPLSDDEIDNAVSHLTETAEISARYKAERVYAEEYKKSLKSILMKEFVNLPISAQEREALAHPRYIKHLQSLKEAVFNDENMRALRTGAEAKIEAWRTKQANLRAIKL